MKLQYNKKIYQTVLLPMTTPIGKYCWIYNGKMNEVHPICPHFDNEGGYGRCDIFRRDLTNDGKGYLKTDTCNSLKVKE